MSKTITMTWKVEQQHLKTFTEKEWAEFVDSLSEGFPTGTSDEALDLVYTYLDGEGYNAVIVLQELASPSNWLDNGQAIISDLIAKEDE